MWQLVPLEIKEAQILDAPDSPELAAVTISTTEADIHEESTNRAMDDTMGDGLAPRPAVVPELGNECEMMDMTPVEMNELNEPNEQHETTGVTAGPAA